MSDEVEERAVLRLRQLRYSAEPVALVEMLQKWSREEWGKELTEFDYIRFFFQAFPDIPLRELRWVSPWHGFGGGAITDEEFNDHLRPWLNQRGIDDAG
jgi:hypothetical protein